MKALPIIFLFLISTNLFAGTKSVQTKNPERLNNEIEKRVGDVAFDLEVMFPDYDTAYYIAYKRCGDSEPSTPKVYVDGGVEHENGFNIVYYYAEGIRHPYHYKCTESAYDTRGKTTTP